MLDAPPPPASGALLISTLNSLALAGSSADKGAQPGAATRQPHLASKAAEEAALRSLSNSHSHSLISSSNASGGAGDGTSKTFTSRHFLQADANGEPDLLTQQLQQQAWRGPNTLGEDDEADLDLALRTMLGGGRSSKALGGMMRSSAAAAGDSAAALFAAEMAGGRGAKARGRSKQPRLGGGKLLPPLQNAGPSVEKIAVDLDKPVGLLEVLSGSVKRKGVVLISKGLEGGGGGRRVAPILSRSLDSLGASAARPKSKE
jgi:hypothetical protein